jgi:hypothetical protein
VQRKLIRRVTALERLRFIELFGQTEHGSGDR